ncbi:MAG: asparagine synthase (glutamine-hydrolyzing) [Deltaproteobacteria bacterium]|nr:MAG: asparagine synthase (glutamine-hydrolyzing) [Deltaproteobacteria bacterium]
MCGIYGYLSPTGTIDPTILRRMGHPLKHRGPDDEGEVILDSSEVSVGLGHKRLSIIDLSPAGKQPMANEDETIWITFNGEIYNFREIRKELEGKGHKFRSHSDTEVIVHLYEELGTKCLERLNGMFAFALWDAKQKSLFLARDRTGKKPLHYCVHRGHFLFASEIKALLQHPLVSREIDLKSLNKYLAYEYVPAPNSIFKAIKKLEPGYCLLFRGGAAVTSQYWDIPMEDYPISDRTEAQYIDELKELLERAVTARLEAADVPVGLFVSGGLDSGVVAAIARKAKETLECFSIGFEEASFDESRYAQQVARSLGIKHHLKVFRAQEMLHMVERLPEILDEPLADPSILPLYLLSQFAAEHMKVVLSGDGGDELFAGYQTYQAHKLVTFYDALPGFVKESVKAFAFRLPVSHKYLSLDFKIKQFLKGVGVSSEVRFFLWRGAFSNAERHALLRPEVRLELQNENAYEEIYRYVRKSGLTKELERILYLSMKLYLQDNNLVTVDRASMANGLEVRSPLLDRDVVDFVCRLPMEYKLNGLKTKYILKKVAEELLPRNVVYRKKKGFGVPLAKWLTGELREFMLDYLSQERIERQGIFHYPCVSQLIDEQLTMKKDNRELLWTLLVFQTWYERYIESAGSVDG